MILMNRIGLIILAAFVLLNICSLPSFAIDPDFAIQSDSVGAFDDGASTADDGIKATLSGDYWRGYLSDTGALYSSPFHWGKTDWEKAGIIFGITLALYKNDTKIQNWFQDHRSGTSNSISNFVRSFGEGTVLLPLSALYIYGCQTDDERARRTALLSLESFIESGLVTTTLKYAGHRSRPYTGDSYDTWGGPGLSTDDSRLSFPSGHSMCAFAVATIVAEEYRDEPLVPVLSYGMATLTALSRINDNKHWASDVFFGSVVGYFTAKRLLDRHPSDNSTWTVAPAMDGQDMGFAVTYRF